MKTVEEIDKEYSDGNLTLDEYTDQMTEWVRQRIVKGLSFTSTADSVHKSNDVLLRQMDESVAYLMESVKGISEPKITAEYVYLEELKVFKIKKLSMSFCYTSDEPSDYVVYEIPV